MTNPFGGLYTKVSSGLFWQGVTKSPVHVSAPVSHPIFGGVSNLFPLHQKTSKIPPASVHVVHPITR